MSVKTLLLSFFLVMACSANANNDNPPAAGTEIKKNDIIGGVHHSDNKKPLANVAVTAFMQNRKEKTVFTNESGTFSFDDLKPGTYKFVFEKDGYRKVTREKTISRVDESFDLSILMDEHVSYNYTPSPAHFFDFE